MGRRINDLTGQRFGRWTVIERAPKPEYNSSTGAFWRCRCDCGTERVVNGNSLKVGISTSCGCYRKEFLSKLMKGRKRNGR